VDVTAHLGHNIGCQKITLDSRQQAGLDDLALYAHVARAGGRAAVDARGARIVRAVGNDKASAAGSAIE